MRRPTLDDVRAAADRAGLRLQAGVWYRGGPWSPGPNCGCALTALAFAAAGEVAFNVREQYVDDWTPSEAELICAWGVATYGKDFTNGLLQGFDAALADFDGSADYRAGHALGLSCRDLIPA